MNQLIKQLQTCNLSCDISSVFSCTGKWRGRRGTMRSAGSTVCISLHRVTIYLTSVTTVTQTVFPSVPVMCPPAVLELISMSNTVVDVDHHHPSSCPLRLR